MRRRSSAILARPLARSRKPAGSGAVPVDDTGARPVRFPSVVQKYNVGGAPASAQKEAHAGGMIQIEHDARLALGETQIASGHKNEGRAALRQLAQDAKAHGFKLTAQKALAASHG